MKLDMIAIDEIRKLTLDSITRGEEMRRQKEAADNEAERQRHEAAKEWAEEKLSHVPELAKEAARIGQSNCVVATTLLGPRRTDWDATNLSTNNEPDWNTKKSGLKYWYLQKELEKMEGFTVKVIYGWDGGGENSWHDLVLSWE